MQTLTMAGVSFEMKIQGQCMICSRSVGFRASFDSPTIFFWCEHDGLLNDDELVWSEPNADAPKDSD